MLMAASAVPATKPVIAIAVMVLIMLFISLSLL
jgi:hypothetical protein